MWIQTEKPLVHLKNDELGVDVEFNSSGSAQVDQETGETLVNHYDSIHRK